MEQQAVSSDDEVMVDDEPVWKDETGGWRIGRDAQITIRTGDRLWLRGLALSTTRGLQIGESTLLPNGGNNIVRFMPSFACLVDLVCLLAGVLFCPWPSS